MRRIVSFVLFIIMLVTVGGCIWAHEREGEEHERRERYEHERHEHERGEPFEHEERRY